jgi:hypothetical protein
MFDFITQKIMASVAQYTTLFDTQTINKTCVTKNNLATIDGLVGEYVLSGAIDGIATKNCLNDLHNFVNGVATTQCFFGNTEVTHNVVAHKVNVGTAIKRELAIEMILDKKIDNSIIVYWDATTNTQEGYKYNISQDNTQIYKNKIGVVYKIKASEIEALGNCSIIDKIVANSIIYTENDATTLIKFESVRDRFYADKFYCVDMVFSYLEDMKINDVIKDRVKHFEVTLIDVETN